MLEKNTLQTAVLVACFWTVILILSLSSYIHLEYQSVERQATQVARSSLEKDQAIRYWVSRRGGLYGQLNEFTQPSPHLAHIPMRDIQTPVGDMTLLNPALILRLIMEEYESLYGVKGRTVGLKVLREENMADEWEANVLDRFQADKELKEYVEINDIDGVAHLRMMTPMYMKEDCMKCHAILGYKVGDLRGGVNVSVPLAEYYAIAKTDSIRVGFAHGGIWLLGLFGIGYVTKRSVKIEELRNRDFHELKETEKALREGDKHFRALFDQSSFGVAKIDSNTGRFIKVNKRYCDMVGYSEAEMLEMGFQEITLEDDLQLDLDNMDRLRAGITSTFQMEKRYQSKNGSKIWVKLTVLPLWNQGKEPDFHLAIVEDITENKNIRVALEDSEALLEKAQKISQIGHWKLDAATGEVAGSDELFRIFGLSKDEATLDTLVGVVHPDERDSGAATIQRGIELGESWDIESRLICSDGTEKWVCSIGEANTDKDGNVVQLVGTVQDITKLKITSNALLESQLWMTSIYNSLDEAVLVVSPDREIINVNDAAIEMFGYSIEEISNNSTELFHVDHEHYLEFGERIRQFFDKGQTAKFEFEAKRKNGGIFPTEHTVSLLKTPDDEVKGIVSVIRDISKRKQDDEELNRLTERLRLSTEAAHIGIWDWDVVKDELTWDGRMFELYGVKEEDFGRAYEAWLAGVHPDDRELAINAVEEALHKKKYFDTEFRIYWPNGEIRYIKGNGQVFWDKDGQPVRMLGVNYDITEQKLAEQSLQKSEARLKEAQRIAKVGVWELDLLANELVWSDEVFRIFEIDKNKFNASYEGFIDAIHPEDRDKVNEAYTESLVNMKPYEIAHRLLMSDGRVKHVHEKCKSFFDHEGKAVRSVGTIHEITERKQAEEELERIFEISPDMIGTGNLQGYFTRINSTFGQMLGYDDEEFMTKPFIEFVHKDDVELTAEALQQAAEGASNFKVENRYMCKDGSFRWIDWDVLAIAQENRFYATGRDITERRENEAELEKYRYQLEELVEDRTVELMKSLAEKEVLLKEVHHRVKNNMAMVSAFIQLQMKEDVDDYSQKALGACENRIRAMSMVHKRLYQSSDFTSIDMQALFVEISDALFKKSNLGNIELDIQVNEISLEMDAAIPCAMIFSELLSNSLKYAFMGGQSGKISVDMDIIKNGSYRIRVSDDGVGFSDEIDINKAETLGLQLVNVFVDQLNGSIEIYRECGAAFEIVFPGRVTH